MAEMDIDVQQVESEEIPRQLSNSNSLDSLNKDDPVNIFCRIKHLNENSDPSCIKLISSTMLSITTPIDNKIQKKDVHYTYTDIFTQESKQKDVFEEAAYPLVQDFIEGKNRLILVHGSNHSGKNFTLTGKQNDPGIIPNCINVIFNTISKNQTPKFLIKSDRLNGFEMQSEKDAEETRRLESKTSVRSVRSVKTLSEQEKKSWKNDGMMLSDFDENNLYAIFVSYIEIYNNIVYDLLDDTSGKTLQVKIVREDANKNMYVNNVFETEVKSPAEAFQLFLKGQKRKILGRTNGESNKSHLVFNIRAVQYSTTLKNIKNNFNPKILKVSQLSIVDIAGLEKCAGKRLKEAGAINNSLISLRICMEILRDNQLNNAERLIPYRDSKLTLLLKSYFEGNGRIHMIICVNPAIQFYEENLQAMKFAEILRDVKTQGNDMKHTPHQKKIVATPRNVKITPSNAVNLTPSVFGPKLPQPKFDLTNPEATVSYLTSYMNIFKARAENIAASPHLAVNQENFRKHLIEAKTENLTNHQTILNLKTKIKEGARLRRMYEKEILHLETVQTNLLTKKDELLNAVKKLKFNVDEKDQKINKDNLKREASKKRIANELEKSQLDIEQHLKRQRDELNTQMYVKEAKLQKIKEVLDGNDDQKTENIEPFSITREIEPSATTSEFRKNTSMNVASQTAFQPIEDDQNNNFDQ